MRVDRTQIDCNNAMSQFNHAFHQLKCQAAVWQPGPMPQEWGTYNPSNEYRYKGRYYPK